jgi:putative tricarboxylic transport membrane protein
MVIGLVLGPMAEISLRRALILSEGSLVILVDRPISATLIALASVIMLFPLVLSLVRRAWRSQPVAGSPEA